jgi:hypothetical protein
VLSEQHTLSGVRAVAHRLLLWADMILRTLSGLAVLGVALAAAGCAAPRDDDATSSEAAATTDRLGRTCSAPGNDRETAALRLPQVSDDRLGSGSYATPPGGPLPPASQAWFVVPVRDVSDSTLTVLKPELVLTTYADTRLCAFTKRTVECEKGELTDGPGGRQGCCADARATPARADGLHQFGVVLDVETPLVDDSDDLLVRVENTGTTCESFSFFYLGRGVTAK